jgi:hypothetical protein
LSRQLLRGFESLSLRHEMPCRRARKTVIVVQGGDVAQLGEHLVRNEGVVGSNPIISTRIFFLEIVLDGEVAVPCTRKPL